MSMWVILTPLAAAALALMIWAPWARTARQEVFFIVLLFWAMAAAATSLSMVLYLGNVPPTPSLKWNTIATVALAIIYSSYTMSVIGYQKHKERKSSPLALQHI